MKTIYADLDSLVFEGREKSYGSYQMRRKANRYLLRASLIAFLLFLSVTVFPKVMSWAFPGSPIPEDNQKTIVATPVKLDNFEMEAPKKEEFKIPKPPAKVVETEKIKKIEFKIPEPKADAKEDETMTENKEAEKFNNLGFETNLEGSDEYNFEGLIGDNEGGDILGIDDGDDGKGDEIGPDDWVNLDREPSPVNMDDVKDLIGYPPMAKEAEIEGTVIMRIQVDRFGNFSDYRIIKNPHPILTDAVSKQLNHLKFIPGLMNNSPVKVWVTIPFKFSLLR